MLLLFSRDNFLLLFIHKWPWTALNLHHGKDRCIGSNFETVPECFVITSSGISGITVDTQIAGSAAIGCMATFFPT